MKCPICNIEIKNPAPHFIYKHNITVKEYYDNYMKKPNEGICPICGKDTKFNGFKGYCHHCSTKCAKLDPNTQTKYEKTMSIKYGITTPFQNEKVKEKIKQTNQERYGGDSPFSSKKVQNKSKQTLINKYGVDNSQKIPEVKEKVKQTCLERYGTTTGHSFGSKEFKKTMQEKYGVEYASQNENIKQKIKDTNIERYGVESILNLEKVKKSCNKKKHTKEADEKRKQTSLQHYGTEYTLQSKEVKNKIQQTIQNRYDVNYPTQNKEILDKSLNTNKSNHNGQLAWNTDKQKQTLIENNKLDFTLSEDDL